MNPIASDVIGVDATTIERELEIAKEQIRAEGKAEEMVIEKISLGKLNKFYKDLNPVEIIVGERFIQERRTVLKHGRQRINRYRI